MLVETDPVAWALTRIFIAAIPVQHLLCYLFTVISSCFPQPDRIKQFGAMTREHEGRKRDVPYRPGLGLEEFRADSARRLKEERPQKETAPPERPRVAFQSPSQDHSTVLSRLANTSGLGLEAGAGFGANDTTSNTEDNHRSLSRTLGEIVAPRFILDFEFSRLYILPKHNNYT